MVSLGKVVLALACNTVMAIQRDNLQTSMDLVARNYSADLKNLILSVSLVVLIVVVVVIGLC